MRVAGGDKGLDDRACVVRRVVIDNDDLIAHIADLLRGDALERGRQEVAAIVSADHYGDIYPHVHNALVLSGCAT
jgi:hypothetical protein